MLLSCCLRGGRVDVPCVPFEALAVLCAFSAMIDRFRVEESWDGEMQQIVDCDTRALHMVSRAPILNVPSAHCDPMKTCDSDPAFVQLCVAPYVKRHDSGDAGKGKASIGGANGVLSRSGSGDAQS